jgi:hypothetical protein
MPCISTDTPLYFCSSASLNLEDFLLLSALAWNGINLKELSKEEYA